MAVQSQRLHDAATYEDLATQGKTLGQRDIEVSTQIGCEFRQVVTLNDEVHMANCLLYGRIYFIFICLLIIVTIEISCVLPGFIYNIIPSIDRRALDTQAATHTDIGIEEVSTLSTHGSSGAELQVHVLCPSKIAQIEVKVA